MLHTMLSYMESQQLEGNVPMLTGFFSLCLTCISFRQQSLSEKAAMEQHTYEKGGQTQTECVVHSCNPS